MFYNLIDPINNGLWIMIMMQGAKMYSQIIVFSEIQIKYYMQNYFYHKINFNQNHLYIICFFHYLIYQIILIILSDIWSILFITKLIHLFLFFIWRIVISLTVLFSSLIFYILFSLIRIRQKSQRKKTAQDYALYILRI